MEREDNIQNWEKMAKLLADDSTPSEKEKLEAELKNNDESNLAEAKNLFDAYPENEEPFEVDIAADFKQVMDKIDAQAASKTKVISFRPKQLMNLAAAVVLLITVGFIYKLYFANSNEVTIATLKSEKKEIQLADGTKVWINSNSIFSYPKEFDGNDRRVKINGEAYFEVKRDPNKPFIIEGSNSQTQVLGTSFNLFDRKENSQSEVNVITGKVAFSNINNPDQKVILEKGQTGEINIQTQEINKKEESDLNILSWKTGIIQFNDAELINVIQFISSHYDISIKLEDEAMNTCKFSGSFNNLSLDEVLKRITQLYGTTIKTIMPNKEILIKKVNC